MPLGVEVGLSAFISGLPVPVCGVIDLVQHDLKAVDYKSAAARPDSGHVAFDHELQLFTYQMMIEEATGDIPSPLGLIYLVKDPANQRTEQAACC
jgi:putative RecB family exonuclease